MNLEDDPLQDALATAFADSQIPQHAAASSSKVASSADSEAPVVPAETGLEESDESWKSDYEHLVAGWHTESAIARQKAEKERERWRLIREKEEMEERERAVQLGSDRKETNEPEWETVQRSRKTQEPQPDSANSGRRLSVAKEAAAGIHDTPPRHGSSSPVDVRDLVAGETSREPSSASPESLPRRPGPSGSEYDASHEAREDISISATAPPSNQDDLGSRTWEQVPSLDSSFPSLSFPDRSAAPSPEPRERPPPPPSVTLAIFDSSLSTRTRVLALVSSLAINMFLPFINGVMLGFGEIFAKNVVSAFGWKLPGMGVGIRTGTKRRQT